MSQQAGLVIAAGAAAAALALCGTPPVAGAEAPGAVRPWVVFEGRHGPGSGKHVVFVTGDDEYRSEEGMPLLARILAERHGFRCTVLFPVNPTTGAIDPDTRDNIPGLEALAQADLMVIFTRFRELPDGQMRHIVAYLEAGRPVIGLRTATHAFRYTRPGPFARWSFDCQEPGFEGGFGRRVLGETWIAHHGDHGRQSTRGIIAPGAAGHPILRGIRDGDIWGPTDVYAVRLPLPEGSTPLVLGQVVAGMDPGDPPAPPIEDPQTHQTVDKNNPMMPVAWVRHYDAGRGRRGRVFTTTMGGALAGRRDWDSEGFRRLFVNACYWAVGLEARIPARANVDVVPGGPVFRRGERPW